jgi:type II secretory pathway component PulM
MTEWISLWHNVTPGQGTLLGGAFVVLAGIIAFSTGALDRRSEHKRFHYEEMKTLYAEALSIGRDLELLKALPPDLRKEVMKEKAEAIDRVISQLALTGNYQTANLAIAYAYKQSVQLGEWIRQIELDAGVTDRIQMWLDNLPDEQRVALQKYETAKVDRRDVVQAARKELGLYVPLWSRYRRATLAVSGRARVAADSS